MRPAPDGGVPGVMTVHSRTLISTGWGIPFTDRSADVLSQWPFGSSGAHFTLVANRMQDEIQVGYAVYDRLRPGMAVDQVQRSGFLWLADPEVLLTLRSRLVDLGHRQGPVVLPLGSREPSLALDA